MFHVPPAGFCLFLQTPFWNDYLFLVFFVSYILHGFYEGCDKICHPEHFMFVYFNFLLKLGDFSFGLADLENILVFERLEVLIESPAALIYILEVCNEIWRSVSFVLQMSLFFFPQLRVYESVAVQVPFTRFLLM